MSSETSTMAPKGILSLISKSFARARESGALTFYASEAVVVRINSLPFAVRFAPALADKAKTKPRRDGRDQTQRPRQEDKDEDDDPFANPPLDLVVTPVGTAHVLLLNKFAVVAGHAILATRAFAPQTDLLSEGDVAAVWACLDEGRDGDGDGDGLFAFYNSGPHSGASQPHRHVQLVPVAGLRDGLAGEWSVLVDALATSGPAAAASRLPFAVFACPMPAAGLHLHAAYLSLYRQACVAAGISAETVRSQTAGPAAISYNLAMTTSVVALCPRTAEGGAVAGVEGGYVGLNGTVLAGTALVKTREEWDALRENPARLADVLAKIGVRPGHQTPTCED